VKTAVRTAAETSFNVHEVEITKYTKASLTLIRYF